MQLATLFPYTLLVPRKFFKKYLPSHETIRQSRFVGIFGERLHHHNLWHLHRRSVAGGVAVGLFTGLIPGSNPVQFFFAALFAVLFKVNLPVAIITTLYSNPFTILPIYAAAYAIGAFVTGEGSRAMPRTELNLMDKSIGDWIPALVEWVVSLGRPLLVGLCCWRCCFRSPATFWCGAGGGYTPFTNGASARNGGDAMLEKIWNKGRKELVTGISSFYGRGGPRTAER